MKSLYESLYESILDIDGSTLDQKGIKALLTQYGIETKGTGKNTVVAGDINIYLNHNSNGEVVLRTSNTFDTPVDELASISSLFPDGATLQTVNSFLFRKNEVHLSELPKNIKIQKYEISSLESLDMLDAEVGSVDTTVIDYDLLHTPALNHMSKYTDTLYIHPGTFVHNISKYDSLVDIKNCSFKNIIWQYGVYGFGIVDKFKSSMTISKYLIDNGQNCNFARRIKTWLKNNPNTNLILSGSRMVFEKLTIKNDEVVATKITQREINKLIQ